MSKQKYNKPRGMQDIFGDDQLIWTYIVSNFESLCKDAGLAKISTPIMENTELFSRAVGDSTEIVNKEMYTFEDRSGNSLTLRPEGTAGVVRAYIENGMSSMAKPVGLYYASEPVFRYERPQSGRYRQHHQLGIEILGDSSESTDVQVICLGARLLKNLNIKSKVSINSIGTIQDRNNYIEVLKTYFEKYINDLPEINQLQLQKNPLRILDTKDPDIIEIVEGAPSILDYLSKDSSAKFQAVLEMLEAYGVYYELNSRLVRGLDYYNDIVFEYISESGAGKDSLGGGGRYDGLISQMGGANTPAVGLGMGIERLKIEIDAMGFKPASKKTDVYVVAIGGLAVTEATIAREKLLDLGLSVGSNFTRKSISDQLSLASKKNSKYALIIGEKEAKEGRYILKDLTSGSQQALELESITDILKPS